MSSQSVSTSLAEVEFVQGEFGDDYDFLILNADGTAADISGFVGGTNKLVIVDSNFASPPVLVTDVTLIPNQSIARWQMGDSNNIQTNYFGSFVAVLIFTSPTNSVSRQTKPLSVMVYPKVPLA